MQISNFTKNYERDFEPAKLADELRHGNLINYMGTPTNCSIKTIYAISQICGETAIYTPIPITEEWLLKFGFVKWNHYNGTFKWQKGNFYILQFGKNAFYCDYSLVFAVDNIHQLQNLYFALTQQELTWQ